MNKPLHYAVLLCAFSAVCCRVAHRTDSFNGRRIRHGSSANEGTRGGAEPSESEMLAQVQADILAGLGITEEMLGSRQAAPEYAAQLAVREAQARDQAIDQTDSGEHFMEGSSNLLLISRKGKQTSLFYICNAKFFLMDQQTCPSQRAFSSSFEFCQRHCRPFHFFIRER